MSQLNKHFMNHRIYQLLAESQQTTDSHLAFPVYPDRPINDTETELLRNQEHTLSYKLSAKQALQREKIVGNLLESGKRFLELRDKTIELTVRMIDLYCMRMLEGFNFDGECVKKAEKGRWVLEKKQQSQIVLVACLFSCAKYNEIYAPSLYDILFVFGECLNKIDVIRRENQVLHVTDFAFEISSASNWFEYYYTAPVPRWLNDCYLKCYNNMETVAKVVRELGIIEVESTIAGRVGIAQRVFSTLNTKDSRMDKNHK